MSWTILTTEIHPSVINNTFWISILNKLKSPLPLPKKDYLNYTGDITILECLYTRFLKYRHITYILGQIKFISVYSFKSISMITLSKSERLDDTQRWLSTFEAFLLSTE